VPDHGIGYGLLRFGSADADLVQDLAALPQAEIILNYTGPRSMGGHAGSPHVRAAKRFTLPPDQLNNVRDPARRRTHLFQVNAGVHDGRLHVHWTYSAQVHDERTVRRLADELRTELTGLIEHASVAEAKATPIAVPSPVRVMADAQVPGATVAVLQDGELTAVHSYGVCVAGGSVPVDPDTLFQAGSISKHLTAMAVLRLVGEGRLDLDEDVNRYLTSWQAPRFPGSTQPLTVRNLLSHLSGLAPVSNQRYLPGEQAPPLLDLLNGRPPVSSPPVHAERAPGAEFRRANVNFSVLQQVLADVTAEPFAPLMRSLVLDPLDMRSSSFDQSFGESSGLRVAHGHDEQGRSIPGGWGIRSELAAAGLWTTAADLSQVVGEVRRAYLGGSSRVLTQAMARQMLTAHSASFYGLGSVVDDLGDDIEFGHGGEPVGYRHMLISRVRAGSGFVVLTNAESGKEVIRFLAAELRGRSLGHGRLAAEWTGDGTGEAMH
jgi:non-ribosomal peptide synthase protein (TIGR01720 family)